MHNPIIGYEKVKVTEIPLSAFDNENEYGDNGGASKIAGGITLGDNGFASDNNWLMRSWYASYEIERAC